MQSVKQIFDFMNNVDFHYVVLRNWDNLPESVELGDHSDLDLLVYDFNHWKELFPEAKAEFPMPRVRFKIPIQDTCIYADIRSIGDGYYPTDFQHEILENKEWNKKGFFTPSPIHHTLALAYHVVHHKNANTYERWLGSASVKHLFEALKKSNIGWVPPVDKSVGAFNAYWRGATSVVSKEDGKITKKQDSFMDYSLIENERRILGMLNSVHFPKLIASTEDEITVEDCGDELIVENLPKNWKEQLVEILVELKTNNIMHRDITPSNLMVNDGIIKLIDFGWAKIENEDDKFNPPACLGYPFKASWGWDDNYSMRQVIKKLQFQQDEKLQEILI